MAKNIHLGIMVEPAQHKALVRIAKAEDRSVSSLVRLAIATYLEQEKALNRG